MEPRMKKPHHSMARQISLLAVGVVLTQSLLLVIALAVGGVFGQSRETAYASFFEKTSSRADFFQGEIDNRWTNLAPYVKEVSAQFSDTDYHTDPDQLLLEVADPLIAMLRASRATGVFLILDDNLTEDSGHSALYLRDYDPNMNNSANSDLSLVVGPDAIANHLSIPLERTWQYDLALTEENADFYRKPYEAFELLGDSRALGHWSSPFRLSPLDDLILTYSVPILDEAGQLRGVVGVEVATDFLKSLLRTTTASAQTSLSYFMATRDEHGTIVPLITAGGYQQRILRNASLLHLEEKSLDYGVYALEQKHSDKEAYACVQPLTLYRQNTPYEKDDWLVVGLIEREELFKLVNQLSQTVGIAFCCSLFLGIIAGVVLSKRIARPIIHLAEEVKCYDSMQNAPLQRTGLTDLDDLADAIERSSGVMLASAMKMSHIITLAGVRIGTFEYKDGENRVLATEQVFGLLNLPREPTGSLYLNSRMFWTRIRKIQSRKEPDEQDVYLAEVNPKKWLKISMALHEGSHLGVIRDVTEEFLDKCRIKSERDFDSLTRLHNRGSFQREVTRQLAAGGLDVAALVMLDLDHLKQINDTYGHEYGDIYIRETAMRLSQCFGAHGIVGRRSGDEFYAFLYGYRERQGLYDEVAAFYAQLEQEKIFFPNGLPCQIRISSGVSWYGVDASDYEQLVRHADFAMYEVKQSDRGHLGEFDPERYAARDGATTETT